MSEYQIKIMPQADEELEDIAYFIALMRISRLAPCFLVRAAIGAFAAKAGGIDALVFTGGIGEHSAEVREKICAPLAFLGFTLHRAGNDLGSNEIGLAGCKPVLIVPADEEVMIRNLCLSVCS